VNVPARQAAETDQLLLLPIPPQNTKTAFLKGLRSRGQAKYSRYSGLPLRYAGGKSLAVGHIIEGIPGHISHLVSPFFGGGSVEIACARELGIKVQGYDLFDILATYWQVQLKSPKRLADILSAWPPDSPTYNAVKERLKAHWRGEAMITDKTELAAHYWFNHNLSYGPGFLGWMSRIYQQPDRAARLIDKVRTFRCPGLSVSQGSFERVIPRHNETFMYCDPPYYLGGDSKMFRGIYPQRNFPVHHNGFPHELLRDLLAKHKGGFVMTYNDCSTIREWYTAMGCTIREVRWQYTMGQGETRIGANRIENGTRSHVKESHELLIVRHGEGQMAKRAMTSDHASRVKTGGHKNEQHFADVIGGRVQRGTHTDKKDVIDGQDRAHSVKAGKWWQIFLYGKTRLETNTIFQGIGEVANIMLDCLDAYPSTFDEYKADKHAAKEALRPHMRRLKEALDKDNIFRAMLDKAMFDGGNADYLSIYDGKSTDPPCKKVFHIFRKDDVVDALHQDLDVRNSRAIGRGTTAEQKVVFWSRMHGKQVGEIEDRHDSPQHYREMKMRLNGPLILKILRHDQVPKDVRPQAAAYGKAARLFN